MRRAVARRIVGGHLHQLGQHAGHGIGMGGNEVVDGGGNRLVDGHGKVQFTGWKFSMKCSSVAVASSTSSGSTASSGLWLMPRVQRMKIMAIGQRGATIGRTLCRERVGT